MSFIDDISLKVKDEDVENVVYEIKLPRFANLQMLCLERFYEEEKDNEKKNNLKIEGKKLIRDDEIESSQKKKWLDRKLLYFLIEG